MKNKLTHIHVIKEFLCAFSEIPFSLGVIVENMFTSIFQSYPTPFYYNQFNQVSIFGIIGRELNLKINLKQRIV